MKKILSTLLISGILSITSVNCFADNNPSLKDRPANFIENTTLEHQVNQTLSNYFPKATFTTVAYENNLLLTGQIVSKAQKSEVLSKIKALPDMKDINIINYLEISKPIDGTQIAKDAYLTTAAKSRFLVNKSVNTNNIKVVTDNGVIYLLGKDAGKQVEVDGAISGIRTIAGTKTVINLISE